MGEGEKMAMTIFYMIMSILVGSIAVTLCSWWSFDRGIKSEQNRVGDQRKQDQKSFFTEKQLLFFEVVFSLYFGNTVLFSVMIVSYFIDVFVGYVVASFPLAVIVGYVVCLLIKRSTARRFPSVCLV